MPQEQKPRIWGRFELITLLGKGGMGDVYKAYDPHLKRYIALKILRHKDAEVVTRFLREARAQARVEHTHVCKIYESGEHNGTPYIAMQFVDGKTLKDMCGELSLEEKLKIIKDVALGLHAAHRQGLIHRDVKPTNVMVQQTEDGHWKPYVMDFGIAREQEAPGLTSTGMVVGTPFYMSPEHARGKLKTLDRRSDIYSLGVTLFEILGGCVPFPGDTPVDILMQVIQKDPQPLRKVNPRIPIDVETIVMKCLEKEPNRRYSSAKELAEDLQNYLDGDPIKARPATITYRIKRKLIKHKWPALVAGISLAVVIVFAGLWLNTRWSASQRAMIAQQLGQEVEKIESTMHYAHLLPIHNLSREKNIIRNRMKKIEEKMAEVGKLGLGPGHYALGRGFVALHDYENARVQLQKAWDSGYRIPEVAYELGQVLGELYLGESEQANRISDKNIREARQKEVEKEFREPAVNYLRQGGATQNESGEFIEALVSFYEKDFHNALRLLKKSMENPLEAGPWMHRANILLGNIYLENGKSKTNFDDALKEFSLAEEAYRKVIEVGESDIRGYLGLARTLEKKIMILFNTRGGDFQELVDRSVSYCRQALNIDPDNAGIYVMEASLYRWLSRHLMISGKDPLPAFEKTLASVGDVITRDPENFEAYTLSGVSHRLRGQYLMQHGQDPTPDLTVSIEQFKKAIKLHPTFEMSHYGLNNAYIRRAQYEISKGKDPSDSLNQAIGLCEKALAINPQFVHLRNGLAGALWFQGGFLMARGKNPRPSYLKSAEALKSAIEINPSVAHFYSNLGFVQKDIAQYELNHSFSPMETVRKAIQNFENSIRINPKGNELFLGLVSVTGISIQYDYLTGKDCSKHVKMAASYLKRGINVNPNDPEIYIRMAGNYIIQARFLTDMQRSPAKILELASGLLGKARDINPKNHEIFVLDGEIALLKARNEIEAKRDPANWFRKTESALKQAEKLNSKDFKIYLAKSQLHRRQAEWGILNNRPVAGAVAAGMQAINKAIDINADYGEIYSLKGVLLRLQAMASSNDDLRLSLEVESRAALLKGNEINRNLKTLYAPFMKKSR